MKPILKGEASANGSTIPPELSVTARELKHSLKTFLEAKYKRLSRSRLSRLIRAGLAVDNPSTSSQKTPSSKAK